MIKVNGRDHQWSEGLTVKVLLEQKKYTFSKIIVRINGEVIEPQSYETTFIQDGDEVIAFHLLAGG
jgi:sulfur carrier protein